MDLPFLRMYMQICSTPSTLCDSCDFGIYFLLCLDVCVSFYSQRRSVLVEKTELDISDSFPVDRAHSLRSCHWKMRKGTTFILCVFQSCFGLKVNREQVVLITLWLVFIVCLKCPLIHCVVHWALNQPIQPSKTELSTLLKGWRLIRIDLFTHP